jgi:hypothetical protein
VHQEDLVAAGTRRPFGIQVGGHRGEEPARDRVSRCRPPFPSVDEYPPLRDVQVTAATIAWSRCVRSAAVSASTSAGDKIRGSLRPARTSETPWRGRDRSRRVGSPRGTGLAATSPRACKNAKKPDTIDKRRRTVAADTPAGSSPGPAACSAPCSLVRPVRWAVMNASTSAGRT